jgi:hypothetical protein
MQTSSSITTALGLESSSGYSIRSIVNNPIVNLNHLRVTELLFRGDLPLQPSRRYSPLNKQQISNLAKLGITCKENRIYVGGLVSLRTKTGININLELFKDTLDTSIVTEMYLPELRNLTKRYQAAVRKVRLLSNSTSTALTLASKQLATTKEEIGLLVLPQDFLSLVANPRGFQEITLPRVGLYALTFIQELDPMFVETERPIEVYDLVDDIKDGVLIAPVHTPLESRFSEVEEPPTVTYPSINKTRKFNNRKMIESKARTAARIYARIKPRLSHMTDTEKRTQIARLRSLRPAMRTIKAWYQARGDSKDVADMIVTPDTYPTLPQVHLTKRSQQVLLDVLEGKEHLHTDFIRQGFK